MLAEMELAEYLDEIRKQACSHCVERPPDGPPCAPLGKDCGVELHLPQLIESIHQVRGSAIAPYVDHNRHQICEHCAFLHSSICPCPMDYLAVLIVHAVETVDERRRRRGEEVERGKTTPAPIDLQEIRKAYRQASGSWTGCDWATCCGKTGLNLQGWSAAQARAMTLETTDAGLVEDWKLAANWLAQVEKHAQGAEARAADAMRAAAEGRWRDALTNAEWAWALEFATGRPLRHDPPPAWQQFREVVEAAYLASDFADDAAGGTSS